MASTSIPPPANPAVDIKTGRWLEMWYRVIDRMARLLRIIGDDGSITTTADISAGNLILTTGSVVSVGGVPFMTQVVKVADQTIASDIILSDDDTLVFPVLANTNYRFRLVAFFGSAAAADFQFDINGPAAPTLVRIGVRAIEAGNPAFVAVSAESGFAFGPSVLAASNGEIFIDGMVQNGVNAGTVSFRWAQNVSDAGTTVIRAGSYLEYAIVA